MLSKLNPVQADIDNKVDSAARRASDLNAAENDSATGGTGLDSDNPAGVSSAENSASKTPSWEDKVTDGPMSSKDKGEAKGVFKKKGPMAAIILAVCAGGIGIGGLFSPALLLVNVKEVMTHKFNTQLASMDYRTTKLLTKKMGTTKGLCLGGASIGCRYGTMSESQIKKFRKAGIEVNYDLGETTMLGRRKPTSFQLLADDGVTLIGDKIPASKFKAELKNGKFSQSVTKAYNPKFWGFADPIWTKVKTKLKISKNAPDLDGKDDAEKLKVDKDVSDGDPVDPNKPDGEKYNPDTAKEFNDKNAAKTAVNEIKDGADNIKTSGIKSAGASLKSGVGKSLKITGMLDNACTAYGLVRSVGYAAKTVRAVQLARYAMLFLNVADQIKAGTAKAEDVAYLGTILTTEIAATKLSSKVLSATDSYGYKYAAHGQKGKMSETAAMYLAGGGLTGKLINFTEILNDVLGGSPKVVCKKLNNPFVGAASMLAGIATSIGSVGLSTIANVVGTTVISVGIAYLPALLQDIVAGVVVDKDTVGEQAGDALVSGSSSMMGSVAKGGGNAPLTPSQAVAYNNLTNQVIARYDEMDRLAADPLDITNSNTFLGSITSQLVPYTSKMSSLPGTLNSLASIVFGSLSAIQPSATKAASEDDYTMCQDMDYKELGVATDPYCNIVYGIPPEALEADPVEVASSLIANGDIDEVTGEPASKAYKDFVTNCIDRSWPLGDLGSDYQQDSGASCLFNENNKNYYIHYIDQRVQAGMDEEEEEVSKNSDTTADPGDASQPANTTKAGSGWVLTDNEDYSGTPCAEGTTPATTPDAGDPTGTQAPDGVYTHPTRKFTTKLCKVGSTPIVVSSLISKRTLNMINAAKNDNPSIALTGGGFRTYEHQKSIWDGAGCTPASCAGRIAIPGNSNHEKGLAIDFKTGDDGALISNDSAIQKWLLTNGTKYGFHKLSTEAWHFSMSGG